MMKRILTIILLASALAACAPKTGLRYPPVMWLRDNDRTPIAKPETRRRYEPTDSAYSYVYEGWNQAMGAVDNIASLQEKIIPGGKEEAFDIDNFDEVPDSTWFTNRIGRFALSAKAMAQPFDPKMAPEATGPLTILSAMTLGKVPRLYVEDAVGRRYILTFDPPGFPGIATGGELIASLLLKEIGYNVAPSYVIELKADRLALGGHAVTRGKYAVERPLTQQDFQYILDRIQMGGRTSVRALATLAPVGEPLGPFSFSGTRYQDTNDRIPHQYRRVLRGYRIFSALINNTEIRDSGTLDTFVTTNSPKGYVRHNLFDLSTAFGNPWELTEDFGKSKSAKEQEEKTRDADLNYGVGGATAAMLTFGFYKPPAQAADCDDRFEGYAFLPTCRFNPEKWNVQLPNEAFVDMTGRDAFWAARIIMRLSDETITKIVQLAAFPDKPLERYITAQLIERRNQIGLYWFAQLNPLDAFTLQQTDKGMLLTFDDLAVHYGFTTLEHRRYRFRLQTRMATAELTPWKDFVGTSVLIENAVIDALSTERIVVLRLETFQEGHRWPMPAIDLSIQKAEDETLRVVGIERND